MLLVDLPVDKIETNPYNPRSNFAGLNDLVSSLETNGQLSPIRVRVSPKGKDKYQLVFGHRRFMAAKKLDWKTIRAEVVSASEEKMAIESLIENLDRKDLSDYEKGLMFDSPTASSRTTKRGRKRVLAAPSIESKGVTRATNAKKS